MDLCFTEKMRCFLFFTYIYLKGFESENKKGEQQERIQKDRIKKGESQKGAN